MMNINNAPAHTREDLFLATLRAATADSHVALEESKLSKALLREDVSTDDYRLYLEKMYGLIKAVERDVFPLAAGALPDIEQRKKISFLEKDLHSLGLSADDIKGIPVSSFQPAGMADALAVMYVFEGSTLGGRIICKHVRRRLGDFVSTSFFEGYGDATSQKWKSFIRLISHYAVSQNAESEIIRSASGIFDHTRTWLG